ncbi:MAG: hypothetical protein AAF333_09620 [Planctomycetota bacterium]
MPKLKGREILEDYLRDPLPKYRLTVTETVRRVYEIQADSQGTVELLARQHDANRHSVPKSVTVTDHQVQVEAIG